MIYIGNEKSLLIFNKYLSFYYEWVKCLFIFLVLVLEENNKSILDF